MTADIIKKLTALLTKGIETEAQVVYLLVGVRKLLEQQDAKKRYAYLTFHCDWALHSKLRGTMAQRVLKSFDAASVGLRAKLKLHDLPDKLRKDIDQISKMTLFEREMDRFLEANGVPTIGTIREEGWARFIHLYSRVIEDCPLVMTTKNPSASIVSVTLRVEPATHPPDDDVYF